MKVEDVPLYIAIVHAQYADLNESRFKCDYTQEQLVSPVTVHARAKGQFLRLIVALTHLVRGDSSCSLILSAHAAVSLDSRRM